MACGEEGSDPLVWHDGRVVRVDEYAASGHLDRLDGDLADVAALGLRVWRYDYATPGPDRGGPVQ